MKPSILIVDDQIMLTDFLVYYFSKNYDVVVKKDGQSALLWLEEGNTPNAIIADINMPKITGFEFLETIKANPLFNDIPVIMLSAKDSDEDKMEYLKLGADDYLTKPFNPEELELKISSIRKTSKS
ncbi:MAG TPA: response regulator transcription factor [Cytophagales bacterium]|nr:response regulator transcription factor [Cytophagales bacterium]